MALLELDNLSRKYGSHAALCALSLTLEEGRIGLLGPNGAGKSTLLKILMGLLPPSSGNGRFLDCDLAEGGLNLRRKIGYLPESDALVYGLTGVEYVALAGELCGMPARDAARRAHEVLYYLGLEEARYRLLDGYSTGMKQRIKLAQALVHDPPVLLLDEPTSGLDPHGREQMLRLLLALGRDCRKTLVLSTHLLGDVERVCETVVILDKGRLLRYGPIDELKADRLDRYRIAVEGEAAGYVELLQSRGVRLLADDGRGELRLAVPNGWKGRDFFTLAADADNVVVRGLKPDEEDLEELFHRVLGERNGETAHGG